MTTAATATQMLVRVTGVAQILLGMLFWSDIAEGLVPAHMLIGIVLVLGLWTLAALGARAGAHPGLVALAALWGLVVTALGMTQEGLLTGNFHWIIQVLHLVVGVTAIALAEMLGTRIKGPKPAADLTPH